MVCGCCFCSFFMYLLLLLLLLLMPPFTYVALLRKRSYYPARTLSLFVRSQSPLPVTSTVQYRLEKDSTCDPFHKYLVSISIT